MPHWEVLKSYEYSVLKNLNKFHYNGLLFKALSLTLVHESKGYCQDFSLEVCYKVLRCVLELNKRSLVLQLLLREIPWWKL